MAGSVLQDLIKIRDSRLYRQDYGTFEEYCRGRWEFTKSYANYLYKQLAAAQTEKNICTTVQKEIPERQLRPLTKLEPEQQKEAWQKAVETNFHHNGNVSSPQKRN